MHCNLWFPEHNSCTKLGLIDNHKRLNLEKGVNFIEIFTDKICQGKYSEEIFLSEEVEFFPNPTNDFVNFFVSGKDKSVDVFVLDSAGNQYINFC